MILRNDVFLENNRAHQFDEFSCSNVNPYLQGFLDLFHLYLHSSFVSQTSKSIPKGKDKPITSTMTNLIVKSSACRNRMTTAQQGVEPSTSKTSQESCYQHCHSDTPASCQVSKRHSNYHIKPWRRTSTFAIQFHF